MNFLAAINVMEFFIIALWWIEKSLAEKKHEEYSSYFIIFKIMFNNFYPIWYWNATMKKFVINVQVFVLLL